MKYFKKLIGENIYLSPRNVEDVEIFTEWLNDFETTDYLNRSHLVTTLTEEKEYLEKNANSEATFVIVTLDTNAIIGTVSIESINHVNRTGTLGIFIGDKNSRNKGFGTEAINLILDFGFNYLNLHNIKLDLLSFNKRALACYQKCGFKEYGRRKECIYVNGKYYDEINMEILSTNFNGNFIKNKNI